VVEGPDKVLSTFRARVGFTDDEPDDTDVDGIGLLSSLAAPTVELSPQQDQKKRHTALLECLDNPKVHLTGAGVRAGPKSPYAVEVVVDEKVRKPRDENGLAHVTLKKDDVYAIRLVNDSDLEACVALYVDGLSVFAFGGHPTYSHVVVAPKSSVLVRGWYRTDETSDRFQVMSYSKSAAAQALMDPGRVGVIMATFAASWKQGTKAPPEEWYARLKERGGEKLATGRGADIATRYRPVARHVGVIRAVVSVRYTR
jgi:hypothetical protein